MVQRRCASACCRLGRRGDRMNRCDRSLSASNRLLETWGRRCGLAGEYHSVVARAAAARADALGLPFLCSSAVLDALTQRPTEWVARLAPAQSRGWRVYADFLLRAGHRRIAVAAEPSVYWASGAGILRDHVTA